MQNTLVPVLFLLFSFQFLSLNGQLSVESELVEETVTVGSVDVVGHNRVTNTSSSRAVYTWTRVITEMTEPWEVSVCDTNLCYLPEFGTAEFQLEPGQFSILDLHLNPLSVFEGKATIEMTVVKKNNPEVSVSATYVFDSTTSSTDLDASAFAVFPNPTMGAIQIKTSNVDITQFELIDFSGRSIEHFETQDGNLDISPYPPGIYHLRAYTPSGAVMVTKQIVKI